MFVASSTPTPPGIDFSHPTLVVLAENLPGPDDLVLAPDGSLFISDVTEGSIKQLLPDGGMNIILNGLHSPEGMVFLPDGSLVIAEQGKNRLLKYNFQDKTLVLFLNLPNRTGLEGVDGLALDARPGLPETIIIPDSPNGVIRRASLDGKALTTVATGFIRPTGAWVEADGSILVADENGGKLVRIHPDGRLETLANLPTPDDVIEDDAGNIFTADLGDNSIHVISAKTGQDALLVNGLSSPQGLVFSIDGALLVTDPGHHRLVKITFQK